MTAFNYTILCFKERCHMLHLQLVGALQTRGIPMTAGQIDLAWSLQQDECVSKAVWLCQQQGLAGQQSESGLAKWEISRCQHDTPSWGGTVCVSPFVWRWGLSAPWRSGAPAGCWCGGNVGGCWWLWWTAVEPASRWSFWTRAGRWSETQQSGQQFKLTLDICNTFNTCWFLFYLSVL